MYDSRPTKTSSVDEFRRTVVSEGRVHRAQLRAIVRVDRSGAWVDDGCHSMANWVAGRAHISWWNASRRVKAAHALESLPLLSEALENGTLGLDKVIDLSRIATPQTERKLIVWARRVTAKTVRDKADLDSRRDRDESLKHHQERRLQWWWDQEGALGIWGRLPAAEGALVADALDKIAKSLPEDPSNEGEDGDWEVRRDRRRADALVALATGDGDERPQATVVVHAELSALTGDGGCEIEGGPIVDAEVARRISCDASLRFVIRDGERGVLGIGRASRNIPSWLHKMLRHRDRECTFPGCERRSYVQAHHIRQWPAGGRSELDNLVLVCTFHHKLVHEFGWRVALGSRGAVQWFEPDGRPHEPWVQPELSLPNRAPPDSVAV